MLHYVHLLVANFVCLPFGAGQVVSAGLSKLFLLKIIARNYSMEAYFH